MLAPTFRDPYSYIQRYTKWLTQFSERRKDIDERNDRKRKKDLICFFFSTENLRSQQYHSSELVRRCKVRYKYVICLICYNVKSLTMMIIILHNIKAWEVMGMKLALKWENAVRLINYFEIHANIIIFIFGADLFLRQCNHVENCTFFHLIIFSVFFFE